MLISTWLELQGPQFRHVAAGLQELATTLQLLFVNDMDIRPEARRALLHVATAWTDDLELPKTDRSVAKVTSLFDWLGSVLSCPAVVLNSLRQMSRRQGIPHVTAQITAGCSVSWLEACGGSFTFAFSSLQKDLIVLCLNCQTDQCT